MRRASLLVTTMLLATAAFGCTSTGQQGRSVEDPLVVDSGARPPATLAYGEGGPFEKEAPGYVRWCASGGAPIVGLPVVDEQERAYVATSDGYLHAFERDGRFRWSYTVKGTPLGSVTLRPSDGAILLGTTGRYIYAINQNGGLRFRYRTLTPVWSGLMALNPSTVIFLGHDRRVYAMSNTGQRRYRVRAPSTPMGGPVIAPGDVIWLPLEDGIARFEAAFKLERFAFPGAVEEVAVLGDEALARSNESVFHVSKSGQLKNLGPGHLLSSDGKRGLIISDSSIQLVDSSLTTRELKLREAPAADEISAAPTLVGNAMWVPYVDGAVRVFDIKSGEGVTIEVGEGALSQPVVGPSGKWALIAEPGGRFCAVELRGR